ncbi:MAG: group 1 glycosyl transferase [Puniceicoccaceae bacterium 5H]|nr:MAG: group 1 glycosyl transferase [Puniceicoccaceae bacterium 5H]
MKILLVTDAPPPPALVAGGGQRTDLVIRALSEFAEVHLLLICWKSQAEAYQKVGPFEALWPGRFAGCVELKEPLLPKPLRALSKVLTRKQKHVAHEIYREPLRYLPHPEVAGPAREILLKGGYDLVFGRFLRSPAVGGFLDAQSPVPIIQDVDDVDSQIMRVKLPRSSLVYNRLTWKWRWPRVERAIAQAIQPAKEVFFVNPVDQIRFPGANSSILPNIPHHFAVEGVGEALEDAGNDYAPTLLFVGRIATTGNNQGVDHFVKHVWPLVRLRVENARLRIVGSGMADRDRAKWSHVPGVDLVGFVEDLKPEYARAHVSICPVYWGGGSKIKIVESMSYGRVVVAAPHAFEAYSGLATHRKEIWHAEDDAKFAEGCIRLLTDAPFRQQMAAAARELVLREFTYDKFKKTVQRAALEAVRPSGKL